MFIAQTVSFTLITAAEAIPEKTFPGPYHIAFNYTCGGAVVDPGVIDYYRSVVSVIVVIGDAVAVDEAQ